jgi:hypothetical protein
VLSKRCKHACATGTRPPARSTAPETYEAGKAKATSPSVGWLVAVKVYKISKRMALAFDMKIFWKMPVSRYRLLLLLLSETGHLFLLETMVVFHAADPAFCPTHGCTALRLR